MARAADIVGLVEACYAPAEDLTDYATLLAEAARPHLEQGYGSLCQLFRLEPPRGLGLAVATDHAELAAHVLEEDRKTKRRPDLLLLGGGPGLVSMQESLTPAGRAALAPRDPHYQALGVRDFLHVTAHDGTDHCVMLGAFCGSERRGVAPGWWWQMVSSHLAAGFRLQRRFDELLADIEDAAIFEPSHRVAHARGRASERTNLEKLREAARRVDFARSRKGRADQELALSAWTGLVDGTWSIVDRHDHDGHRYIVAVPNDPEVRDPRGLTRREAQVAALTALGHPGKLIAYSLGLSRSTVASHLARALTKLGLDSRMELVRLFTRDRRASDPK